MHDAAHIAEAVRRAGIEPVEVEALPTVGVVVRVEPEQVASVLTALRDDAHEYRYPVDIFGVDTGEGVDVVYHLRSLSHGEEVLVKATHPYGGSLASVWEIFPAALMPEREIAEMFGLSLEGHPNPKHLLLTKGSEPLLLKRVPIRSAEEVRAR